MCGLFLLQGAEEVTLHNIEIDKTGLSITLEK